MNHEDVSTEVLRASGEAVLELVAPMEDEAEFFASRNTITAVENLLLAMASALARLPATQQTRLHELDWHGWSALYECLLHDRQPRHEEIWYAVSALVPCTLSMFRRKRVVGVQH